VTDHADPLELAHSYCAAGASALHLVDLEGARSGRCAISPRSLRSRQATECASRLVVAPKTARSSQQLSCGAGSVIIATTALGGGEVLSALTAEFAGCLIVSLDSRGDAVLAKGWASQTGLELVTAARVVIDCGITRHPLKRRSRRNTERPRSPGTFPAAAARSTGNGHRRCDSSTSIASLLPAPLARSSAVPCRRAGSIRPWCSRATAMLGATARPTSSRSSPR